MIWLLLTVACVAALFGWLAGARVWVADALFDRLGEAEDDLAVERERADALAAVVRDLLDGRGDGVASIDQADAALRAHDGQRGQR